MNQAEHSKEETAKEFTVPSSEGNSRAAIENGVFYIRNKRTGKFLIGLCVVRN